MNTTFLHSMVYVREAQTEISFFLWLNFLPAYLFCLFAFHWSLYCISAWKEVKLWSDKSYSSQFEFRFCQVVLKQLRTLVWSGLGFPFSVLTCKRIFAFWCNLFLQPGRDIDKKMNVFSLFRIYISKTAYSVDQDILHQSVSAIKVKDLEEWLMIV